MSRSLVLLFIVIVLTGCSATGPRYSEHKSTIPALTSESSRIFFFRNSRFMSGGSDAEIYINDKKVGECADDAYFFTDTVPGHVKIKTETFGTLGSHEIEKELEGGNEYYFEILVNTAYVYSSVFVGVIGQAAYAGSNENTNGWIFKEVKREEAIPQLTDKIFSLDGE